MTARVRSRSSEFAPAAREALRDATSALAALLAIHAVEVHPVSTKDFADLLDARGLIGWPVIGVARGRGKAGALLEGLAELGLVDELEGRRWKLSGDGFLVLVATQAKGRPVGVEEVRNAKGAKS